MTALMEHNTLVYITRVATQTRSGDLTSIGLVYQSNCFYLATNNHALFLIEQLPSYTHVCYTGQVGGIHRLREILVKSDVNY